MRYVLAASLLLAGCTAYDPAIDDGMRLNDAAVADVFDGVADDLDGGRVQFGGLAKALVERRSKVQTPELLGPLDATENAREASTVLRRWAASRRRVSASPEWGRFLWYAIGCACGGLAVEYVRRKPS